MSISSDVTQTFLSAISILFMTDDTVQLWYQVAYMNFKT